MAKKLQEFFGGVDFMINCIQEPQLLAGMLYIRSQGFGSFVEKMTVKLITLHFDSKVQDFLASPEATTILAQGSETENERIMTFASKIFGLWFGTNEHYLAFISQVPLLAPYLSILALGENFSPDPNTFYTSLKARLGVLAKEVVAPVLENFLKGTDGNCDSFFLKIMTLVKSLEIETWTEESPFQDSSLGSLLFPKKEKVKVPELMKKIKGDIEEKNKKEEMKEKAQVVEGMTSDIFEGIVEDKKTNEVGGLVEAIEEKEPMKTDLGKKLLAPLCPSSLKNIFSPVPPYSLKDKIKKFMENEDEFFPQPETDEIDFPVSFMLNLQQVKRWAEETEENMKNFKQIRAKHMFSALSEIKEKGGPEIDASGLYPDLPPPPPTPSSPKPLFEDGLVTGKSTLEL